MEIEVELPMQGSFYNKAGQLIEYWRDPKDPHKCKILVNGQRIDWTKYLEQEAQRLKALEEALEPKD